VTLHCIIYISSAMMCSHPYPFPRPHAFSLRSLSGEGEGLHEGMETTGASSAAPRRSLELCRGRSELHRDLRAEASPRHQRWGRGRLHPPTDGGTPPRPELLWAVASRGHSGEELVAARGRARSIHGHGGAEKAALAPFVTPPCSGVAPSPETSQRRGEKPVQGSVWRGRSS
jgi:hypothetical protein